MSAFHGPLDDGALLDVWHIHEDDLARQTRELRVVYERTSPEGVVSREQSVHYLRYVYPAELELLVALTGLAVAGVYGDYDLGALTNDSERMIVVAQEGDA